MQISNRGLSFRFSFLVAVVSVLAVCVYIVWTLYTQDDFARERTLVEARALNLEMQASWDYIDASQDAMNYNSDGAYDFKDIYCSIAGKNIAYRFTNQADGYIIRFARENPRTGDDSPDEFEQKAIDTFRNTSATEYYDITDYGDTPVFRYASALEIKNNCLNCHGMPKGERDETGYLKEGMELGDLAGITSIIIPLDVYNGEGQRRIIQGTAFFLALSVAIIFLMRFALKRWVIGPLNSMNDQLIKENRAQQNFLAIVSHELRTPLSSIIAFSDLWESGSYERSGDEQKLVSEIKENSRTLLDLVNNTIDTAKVEAGEFKITLDEVDIVDVVQSVDTMLGPLAKKNDITVTRSIDSSIPIIFSDSSALRKILSNILGNAIKYSYRGGSVAVKVYPAGDVIKIVVSDNGPGISMHEKKTVFGRFKRIDSDDPSRKTSGSGLGLYLAKSLIEQLGGDIELESELGNGSTFTIIVPVDSRSLVPKNGGEQP